MRSVNSIHIEILDTFFQTKIIWILEIKAAISTSSSWTGSLSVIHEIMANKSD